MPLFPSQFRYSAAIIAFRTYFTATRLDSVPVTLFGKPANFDTAGLAAILYANLYKSHKASVRSEIRASCLLRKDFYIIFYYTALLRYMRKQGCGFNTLTKKKRNVKNGIYKIIKNIKYTKTNRKNKL